MIQKPQLVCIGSVPYGAVVEFPHSVFDYLRVFDGTMLGAVVRLHGGDLIPVKELHKRALGNQCYIVANSVDELYREENR